MVFELVFDEDPRAFFNVSLDTANVEIDVTFDFADDGGDIELARTLAESSADIIQLSILAIGGRPISMVDYDYGHYEDQFTFDFGDGRNMFDDAE